MDDLPDKVVKYLVSLVIQLATEIVPKPWLKVIAGVVVVALIVALSYTLGVRQCEKTAATATTPATPTLTPSRTPTATPTETPTCTPSPTPTCTPSPTPIPEWKTNISDGDQVAQTTTLIAEYSGDLEGDLWVFVVPSTGRFYPQSPDASRGEGTPRVDGKWEIQLGLGNPEDVGAEFDIVLAVAEAPLDNQFIAGKLIAWHQEGEFVGFETMPKEVVEVHRIHRVVRTEERWGRPPAISNAQLVGQVDITNVADKDLVTDTVIFEGEYRDITGTIWILVYPAHGHWYPQSEAPWMGIHTRQEDGRWQVPVIFGGDEARIFDVVVLLADDETSEFFDTRQRSWCKAGHYFGFLTIELPQGIEEKHRVRVFRE
jgi:hypothetical protein